MACREIPEHFFECEVKTPDLLPDHLPGAYLWVGEKPESVGLPGRHLHGTPKGGSGLSSMQTVGGTSL